MIHRDSHTHTVKCSCIASEKHSLMGCAARAVYNVVLINPYGLDLMCFK